MHFKILVVFAFTLHIYIYIYIYNYIYLPIYLYIYISAANRGRSTVSYRQSLVFDRPYLSCNGHCDRRVFQEILIFFFGSSSTQILFKAGVVRDFVIFTEKHLCWSQTLWPATLFQPRPKRDFNTEVFL